MAKIIEVSALATVLISLLWITKSKGAPLSTGSKPSRQALYYYDRAMCFKLIEFVGRTKREFADDRFKNENYDHFVKIPGVHPVWDFVSMPEQVFLRMQANLMFTFIPILQDMVSDEEKNPGPGHFDKKIKEIFGDVRDLSSSLRQLEKILNYRVTLPGKTPYPTMKPQATQKERDEWKLGVLKELFMSLIAMQSGLREQMSK